MTLKTLLTNTTKRYISIGLSVYLIELLIIFIAKHQGAGDTLAVALSFWLGLLISFFLQKLVTFKDKRMHHKILLPQLIAVSLLVLFNFGFTLLVTKLLRGHVPVTISRTVALGITTIWNFYIYQTRIFKTDNTPLID